MTTAKMLGVGLLIVALSAAGCSRPTGTAPGAKNKSAKEGAKKAEHAHGKGPNGGVVFDLGKHHAEFLVDHAKKECTVNILGDDETTPTPVAAKELTLTTKATKTEDGKAVPAMTIKLLPRDEAGGKSSRFVGTDPGLANVADFEGTVLGEIEGRPSQGEFKEEDEDHKHDKKK